MLSVLLHVRNTKEEIRFGLAKVWTWLQQVRRPAELSWRQQQKRRRYADELLRARIDMLHKFNKFMIHVSMTVTIVSMWKLAAYPSFLSVAQMIGPLLAYCLDTLFHEGIIRINSANRWRYLQFVGLSIHAVYTVAHAFEPDPALFAFTSKLWGGLTFLISVMCMDSKVTVPLFAVECALQLHQQYRLVSLGGLARGTISVCIASDAITVVTMIFVDHVMQSEIKARIDSTDASSLKHGFRQVLRGVCDGDLLLDRRNCTIVDDASCLERLLKSSRKLSDTNFLDLFLDAESRENFLQFLAGADDSKTTMPRGLRVSLQGKNGPVSLDLFHTTLPNHGAARSDYCLLAMKEDHDGRAEPPDAPPGSVPALPTYQEPRARTRTRSSVSEVVEAYDELVEISLLVSNCTGLLDIEEAHLRFDRGSSAQRTIETGMPTLRRFIRPTDWDRIEGMLNFVMQLEPSPEARPCYFKKPMLFRLPGESRSYLCARQASVSMADRTVEPGQPVRFWMHLTAFDSSHVQRPREQELELIQEDPDG